MADNKNPLSGLLGNNKDDILNAGKDALKTGGFASFISSLNPLKSELTDEDKAQIESMYKNVLVPTQGLKDSQLSHDARPMLGEMAAEKGWSGTLITSTLKDQGHITRKEANGLQRFIDDYVDHKNTINKPSAYKAGHGLKGKKRWLVAAGFVGLIAGGKLVQNDTNHINDAFDAVAQTNHTVELIEQKVSTDTAYKQCVVNNASLALTNSYVKAESTNISAEKFQKDFISAQQSVPSECRSELGVTTDQTKDAFSAVENTHMSNVIMGIGAGLAQKL